MIPSLRLKIEQLKILTSPIAEQLKQYVSLTEGSTDLDLAESMFQSIHERKLYTIIERNFYLAFIVLIVEALAT